MTRKQRLDQELVAQGYFATQDEAMRAVLAGLVSTSDRRMTSAGEQVEPGIALHVKGHEEPFVSRGGRKLKHALTVFSVDPTDLVCLDVGCSTGGFTDCLLKAGARRVTAVDVGYAQFDWRLRNDQRVELLERTNIVTLPAAGYAGKFDLAVCDVSFTSIGVILPAVCACLCETGLFVTLVKPQFEAARTEVGSGGIVRSPEVHKQVLSSVAQQMTEAGFGNLIAAISPITGHKGNVEYLMCGRIGAPLCSMHSEDIAALVARKTGTIYGSSVQ